jgi:hypothetical protein
MKDLAPDLSEMYQTDVGVGIGNWQRERETLVVRSVVKVADGKESEELLKILNICFHLRLITSGSYCRCFIDTVVFSSMISPFLFMLIKLIIYLLSCSFSFSFTRVSIFSCKTLNTGSFME